MSWVISLVLAGLMITPAGSNLSINTSNNFVNANAPVVVSLNETERFEQTYPLNANGRVSVSNINGSITVEAWDKNEVRLEAVKTADTKETLAEVQVRIDARPDSFKVETDYGSWRNNGAGGAWKNKNHGRLEVQYRLQVPRGAVLDEVETVNGSVTISNMTNSTKASAVNGNVKATNLRGTARISTVNGTTEADFDSVSNTGRISLETVNGKVILTVPSDINATVRADSLNGQIINDFGLPVRKGEYVGRDLYGRIGTGELQIRLESVNGDLIVRRKQDGKTPNPAVNLLNQKSKADDAQIDEDVDEDTEEGKRKNKQKADRHEKVGKVNVNVREIQRAIEESQKENLRALKLSQKELERIQPELNRINLEALKDAAKIINSEEIRQRLRHAQIKQRELMLRASEIGWVAPAINKKTETFKVKGTPKVTVEARNCSVTVKGWDKPEVQYLVTKFSKLQQPVNYKVDRSDTQVNIRVTEETAPLTDSSVVFGDLSRVRVEVYVPKKSNLRILTNREIRIENVSGDVELEGGEDAVNIRDVDGRLRVATRDGSIRVIGFRGDLESRTVDGAMNLEGDFQKINAQTADGTIVLTLPENVSANIESNREDIETEGISLVRAAAGDKKNVSVWKVGNGGGNSSASYRLYTTADGQIFIRSSNNLRTSF